MEKKVNISHVCLRSYLKYVVPFTSLAPLQWNPSREKINIIWIEYMFLYKKNILLLYAIGIFFWQKNFIIGCSFLGFQTYLRQYQVYCSYFSY
jgi:hypothetical protein